MRHVQLIISNIHSVGRDKSRLSCCLFQYFILVHFLKQKAGFQIELNWIELNRFEWIELNTIDNTTYYHGPQTTYPPPHLQYLPINLHPTSHWPLDVSLNKLIVTRNDDEISASPRNIGIYMILFQQNCNNLKMDAIGRNM